MMSRIPSERGAVNGNRPNGVTLHIGTRGSELALWQARHVADLLAALGVATEIVVIKTRGDRITDVPLARLEGKGFFTKELEEAQLAGRVDLAVHSLKDLATDMPAGLALAALVGRADPRDLLLARPEAVDPRRRAAGEPLPLRAGARVGTSAVRRQAQLRDLRPDLVVADLRGNVPTRVGKLRDGAYDAVLLAQAGVERLGLDLSGLESRVLEPEELVPAPGQGMLGIQCRDEPALRALLAKLHCGEAAAAVAAERWLLDRLDAGCQVPLGVHVRRDGARWRLDLFWQEPDAPAPPLRHSLRGDDPRALAERALALVHAGGTPA